ncbi:MAG: alpha-L-fucosidase, partial [Clostridia bacterium]|nr:alpha-L-fucosidase [Clostridia bacterium]
MFIAKPTKQQLAWHEMELGVLIHFCPEMYRPDLTGDWYKTRAVREAIAPQTIHPAKLSPEQWVRCAARLGAKYAVMAAKHVNGFAMWDTKVNDFSIARTDWRAGGGDACREFVDACRKYGIKPGFYYSTVC